MPKNGLYMTEADIESFNSWFSRVGSVCEPESRCDLSTKNISIVLGQDCNFNCSYCYMHGKNSERMSIDTAREAADFLIDGFGLSEYLTAPCVVLDFIGGEPLLYVQTIDKFMERFLLRAYEKSHPWGINHAISMSSNGSLFLTPESQNFFRKYRGRANIGITIDGDRELHDSCRVYRDGRGTYDDVYRALNVAMEMGYVVSTKVTIAPENMKRIPEAILHLFGLGLTGVSANVVFEDVWSITHAREFYVVLKELADMVLDGELYKLHYTTLFTEKLGTPLQETDDKNWCGGDGSMLAIGPDGILYPCIRYMGYSLSKNRNPYIIGNLKDGINTASNEVSGLKSITRRSQSDDECFNCPVAQGCAWCSGFNYDVFGTPNKRTKFHCNMHKARVLANVYFWNKLYKKLGLITRFPYHMPDEWAEFIISKDEVSMLKALSGPDCDTEALKKMREAILNV
jgi:uncharacterized protein